MSGTAAPGIGSLLLGSAPALLAAERHRQLAVGLWLVSGVLFATGLAARPIEVIPDPWAFTGAIGFSMGYALRTIGTLHHHGLGLAIAAAVGRIGLYWVVIAAVTVTAVLLAPVVPDETAWTVAPWAAAAGLSVSGVAAWSRDWRGPLGIVGMAAGFTMALGSLVGLAIGGAGVLLTVAGIPTGLALLYVSGRYLADVSAGG